MFEIILFVGFTHGGYCWIRGNHRTKIFFKPGMIIQMGSGDGNDRDDGGNGDDDMEDYGNGNDDIEDDGNGNEDKEDDGDDFFSK